MNNPENCEKDDGGSSSSEEEHNTYKIFKKYTNSSNNADSTANKCNMHEGKLLGALNMYTKRALLQRQNN